MRIASYNIQSGGFLDYSSKENIPERLQNIKKAIKTFQADVVVLIDTYRWDEIYDVEKLKNIFGYESAYLINLEDPRLQKIGHDNGIAILSNVENIVYETVRIATRNCIKVSITDLDVFAVYLDDLSEDTRIIQTYELMKYIDPVKKSMIVGDLNTISIHDKEIVQENIKLFMDKNPMLASKFLKVLEDMLRCGVTCLIEEHGFYDAGQKAGDTMPSMLFSAKTTGPFLRLDYAFVSKDMIVDKFVVKRKELFDKTSDHYPIVIDVS